MFRILRLSAVAILISVPALALARPPQIYHHTVEEPAKAGATVRLQLGSQDAQITVKPVKSVSVTVDIRAHASSTADKAKIVKRLAPVTNMQGNDVLIRAPESHGWHWSFGWDESPDVRVTVVMPPDMKVVYRLGSGDFRFDNAQAPNVIQGESGSGDAAVHSASKHLKLQSGSGDLEVRTTGNPASVSLHSGSGDIEFSGAADALKLHSGSGDITVGNATAKTASFHSGSGDITVRNATAKTASLHSGSGEIEVHWRKLAAGASIKGESGSGDITLYFPAGTVIAGSLSTDSGDVTTQFPATIQGDEHSYTLSGGTDAVKLNLTTGSGDINLRKGG